MDVFSPTTHSSKIENVHGQENLMLKTDRQVAAVHLY